MEKKVYKPTGKTAADIDKEIEKAKQDWFNEIEQKLKVRGKLPFTPKASDYETPKGKSMTIQDDSYTIQDILSQYVQGAPLQTKGGVYLSGDDDEELDAIDLEKHGRGDTGEQFRTNIEHLERIKHVRSEQEKARKSKKPEKKEQEE